jgi:hypothetical protein
VAFGKGIKYILGSALTIAGARKPLLMEHRGPEDSLYISMRWPAKCQPLKLWQGAFSMMAL